MNADAAKSLAGFMLLSLDFIVDRSNKVKNMRKASGAAGLCGVICAWRNEVVADLADGGEQ